MWTRERCSASLGRTGLGKTTLFNLVAGVYSRMKEGYSLRERISLGKLFTELRIKE
jgi:ABC-type nitrate/sulfonate/bicarbonate transport system ATPase subunit